MWFSNENRENDLTGVAKKPDQAEMINSDPEMKKGLPSKISNFKHIKNFIIILNTNR